MLPELGHYGLILALCLSALQTFVLCAPSSHFATPPVMRTIVYGQAGFVLTALLSLTWAFVSNDFSVLYVAQNSNTHLPLFYRIGAVWGAHEGSLLLWVGMLNAWAVVVALCSRDLSAAMTVRILSVMGAVSFGLLLFLLLTSNPFLRTFPNVPAEGRDLNPLLQDPGLVIHPPLLYMGYVGFSVAFAFAIAGLMVGKLDSAWARSVRSWTLLAWCFLTAGIILGSWWAYRELGWGGWWYWDPVENASFLPWLVGTALIHSLMVTEKRGLFQAWTALLAICTFSLSLLGTFLVRSGVLISVHSFANDPRRGVYLLFFLAVVVGASLLLFAWRGPALVRSSDEKMDFAICSRESILWGNNLLLTLAMSTVLLGTIYPLLIDALGVGKISVGPPYFNLVFLPIMAIIMIGMGFAPLLNWLETDWRKIGRDARWIILLAGLGALLIVLCVLQRAALSVGLE